jgi:hypothetical protein
VTARGLALLAAFALAAQGHAQDETPPPVPVEETGGEQQEEQQQDEKKDEQQETGDQVPPPAQDIQEPAPAEAAPADDAPAPLTHPTVAWPMSAEALVEHLRLIASAHPECAKLETLGTSAAGRPILALRLGASGPAPVLFLAEHRGSASAAPEALVEVAWRLAESFQKDEGVRALLTASALVLAPALDPDRRAAGEPPAVRFELNFPSGWQPESVRPGAGRTSLSKPEALAVARYLAELSSASIVLGFTERLPRGAAYAGAQQPEADRAVHENLRAALELPGVGAPVPWFELGSPGGGLLDFAYQARGLFALALPLPGEDQLVAGAAASYVEPLQIWVTKCLTLLPRIELAEEGLERLASDTWQLDVRIRNAGLVPTQSAVLRARERAADVALELAGAKLVATAKKPTPEAPYTDASFQAKSPLSAGTLAGGEGRWLRLILEAQSGAAVSVASGSLWAGKDKLELVLP